MFTKAVQSRTALSVSIILLVVGETPSLHLLEIGYEFVLREVFNLETAFGSGIAPDLVKDKICFSVNRITPNSRYEAILNKVPFFNQVPYLWRLIFINNK